MRDDERAGILERLATRDMVVMMVAVDQVFDRRPRDLANLVDVSLRGLRAQIGNRIGRDDTLGRDDEHRLITAIAENVDVVGDLRRREKRWRSGWRWCARRLRRRHCRRDDKERECGKGGQHTTSSCYVDDRFNDADCNAVLRRRPEPPCAAPNVLTNPPDWAFDVNVAGLT